MRVVGVQYENNYYPSSLLHLCFPLNMYCCLVASFVFPKHPASNSFKVGVDPNEAGLIIVLDVYNVSLGSDDEAVTTFAAFIFFAKL